MKGMRKRICGEMKDQVVNRFVKVKKRLKVRLRVVLRIRILSISFPGCESGLSYLVNFAESFNLLLTANWYFLMTKLRFYMKLFFGKVLWTSRILSFLNILYSFL